MICFGSLADFVVNRVTVSLALEGHDMHTTGVAASQGLASKLEACIDGRPRRSSQLLLLWTCEPTGLSEAPQSSEKPDQCERAVAITQIIHYNGKQRILGHRRLRLGPSALFLDDLQLSCHRLQYLRLCYRHWAHGTRHMLTLEVSYGGAWRSLAGNSVCDAACCGAFACPSGTCSYT